MVYNYCEHITDNIENFDMFDICKIDIGRYQHKLSHKINLNAYKKGGFATLTLFLWKHISNSGADLGLLKGGWPMATSEPSRAFQQFESHFWQHVWALSGIKRLYIWVTQSFSWAKRYVCCKSHVWTILRVWFAQMSKPLNWSAITTKYHKNNLTFSKFAIFIQKKEI